MHIVLGDFPQAISPEVSFTDSRYMPLILTPSQSRHRKRHSPQHKCPEAGCNLLFQYKKDADRHRITRHRDVIQDAPLFYCPHSTCKFHIRGFPRQDNFQRHVRTQHGDWWLGRNYSAIKYSSPWLSVFILRASMPGGLYVTSMLLIIWD